MIPHYPNFWSGERNPTNYFCLVCQTSHSSEELIATYERTKREWEVFREGETTPEGGRAWSDPPNEPGKGPPQAPPEQERELSPEPNEGAARGRRAR